MSTDFSNWLFGGTKSREDKENLALYREAVASAAASPFADEKRLNSFIFDLILESSENRRVRPSLALGQAMWEAIEWMLQAEGFLLKLPPVESLREMSLEDGVTFRKLLARHKRFNVDNKKALAEWRERTVRAFSLLMETFPLSAFEEVAGEESKKAESIPFPEAAAHDLMEDLPGAIELAIVPFYDDEIFREQWFERLRRRIEANLVAASGLKLPWRDEYYPKIVLPSAKKGMDSSSLLETYLGGTPLKDLFEAKVPFAIPFPARFEHTHILAGSGHGKTQLLQFMVHHDLVKALDDGRSVVVMDSQGDMIRTLSHLKLFDSAEARNLADRFVLVDPTDVEHPVGLNMFDFDRARVGELSTKDRETILNATVETYEYFFGALLGAELTQRQGVIFRYIARLMMEIPGATIHTLLELMMNGEKYRPYMQKLTGTARTFFETQFFDRQFSENKKQVTARLWGVLSNTTLERMFSHPVNKLDLFKLTQEGKIILINTAKDFLGHEGSAIFGRFVVSLIAQAAIQRAILPSHERTPTFAYIDEAEEYFDSNIDRLVNQARKYKIGLVFSHQNLDQLSPALRASVLSSTSIKFAGGLSSKDANALDDEFRTSAQMLLDQRKHADYTEFACYVKNFSPRAVSVRIPLGYVEGQPRLDEEEYLNLLEGSRERYGIIPEIPDIEASSPPPRRAATPKPSPETPRPEPVSEEPAFEPPLSERVEPPPDEVPELVEVERVLRAREGVPRYTPKVAGGGGKQHKYLANLVKGLAEERGFKAAIEETILDGAGRVDVSLSRGERRIAVEISVTTGRDWELQNVEKCISAGFAEVLVVSTNERHLKSLARFIPDKLEEADRTKVQFLSTEDFIAFLDQAGTLSSTEKVVRGYKVRVTSGAISNDEAEEKRSTIAEVIAKSMLRNKEQ